MTDLLDLLDPNRILCRCEIRSKKRALQTLAELLGSSLRDESAPDIDQVEGSPSSTVLPALAPGDDIVHDNDGEEFAENVRLPEISAERRRSRRGNARSATDDQTPTISDMGILDALITRERLGSTGIGHGIALPHSRLAGVDRPLAALITLQDGVDFESLDGEAVDIVLGLLVPEDCNDEHLKILAGLAKRFSDEHLRDALRQCRDDEQLLARLRSLPPTG